MKNDNVTFINNLSSGSPPAPGPSSSGYTHTHEHGGQSHSHTDPGEHGHTHEHLEHAGESVVIGEGGEWEIGVVGSLWGQASEGHGPRHRCILHDFFRHSSLSFSIPVFT